MERLTPEAKRVIEFARDEARRLGRKKVRTEHLLLGLLRCGDGLAARILRARGLTLEGTRVAVDQAVGRGADEGLWTELIPFAGRSMAVLELAEREAISFDTYRVGTEHILLGLLRNDQGAGARVLAAFDVDYRQTRDAVVAALVSARPRLDGRGRPRHVKLALGVVAVFAVGVLVGQALRRH